MTGLRTLLAILVLTLPGFAQEQQVQLDRLTIEPDQLRSLIQSGGLIPLDRKELEQRIKAANLALAPPSTLTADRITYTARFIESGSLEGSFEAKFTNARKPEEDGLRVLMLGQAKFSSFRLSEKSTTWGMTLNGTAAALVDGEAESVSGVWKLKGNRRAWGTRFDLQPLNAAASELVLTLPRTYRVQSNATIVNSTISNAEEQQWRVMLDSTAPTRLSIVKTPNTPVDSPARVEVTTTWTLRQENTSLRSEYLLQSQTPIDEFSVYIPEGSTVESVSYGDSTTLPIELTRTSKGPLLRIQLPDTLTGASRKFVLAATAPAVGSVWTVPSPDLIACRTVQGNNIFATAYRVTQRLRIEAPLELQQLELSGYDQKNSVFDLDGTQTISLDRIFADATASLRVGQARQSRQYQIATRISPEAGVWKHNSLLTSSIPLPGEVNLSLPTDFTVLEVNAGPDRTPCDFRIEGAAGSLRVRVFVPPIGSSILQLTGHTRTVPTAAISTTDGTLATHVMVVPVKDLATPQETLQTLELDQLPTAIREQLPPQFLDSSSIIVEARPGIAVKLKEQSQPVAAPAEEPGAATPTPRAIVLPVELTSVLQQAPAADKHIARVVAGNDGTFEFDLTDEAAIKEIRVNERKTRFRRNGASVLVPIDPSVDRNQVEIRYECTPAAPGVITQARRIPVPQFSTPGGLSWDVTLPSGARLLTSAPTSQQPTYSNPLLNALGPLPGSSGSSEPSRLLLPTVPKTLAITTFNAKTLNRIGWIAMAASLTLGIGIVHLRSPAWLCAFEAIIAFLCFVVPDPFGTICGGCLLGGLIALVVSNIVQPAKQPAASGLTQSRIPSTHLGTLLLLICFGVATTTIGQDQDPDQSFRVFAVQGQNTVYVEKALLDYLETTTFKPTSPTVLLQQADYTVRYADNGFSIDAKITAMCSAQATDEISVSLPFANANVNECRVNGNQQIFRKQDGAIVFNILADQSAPTAKEPRKVVIELQLFPPVTENRIQLQLPAASISTCLMLATDDIDLRLNNNSVVTDTPYEVSERIEVAAGSPEKAEDETPLATRNQCSIEVAANETLVTHELTLTPGSKPLRQIDLMFPASYRFVSLTASELSREEIITGAASNYISVEFMQPVTAPVEIQVKLAETNTAMTRNRSLHLLPIVPGFASDEITLSSKAGLQIANVQLVPDESTISIQAISDIDPTTFALAGPARVLFDSSTPTATREIAMEQQIVVEPNQLDYSLTAEFRIQDGPVFAHTLKVPEGLLVDTIVVRENGVDRLARYQRSGSELLLLLEGRTSGTQDVQLQGRVPRTVDAVTPIPEIKVTDANLRESSLTIRVDPSLELTLENREGTPFTLFPDGTTPTAIDGETSFDLPEDSRPPLIRTSRKLPEPVDAVCLVQPTASGAPSVQWLYNFKGQAREVLVNLNGGALKTAENAAVAESGDNALIKFPASGAMTFSVLFDVPATNVIPNIEWKTNVAATNLLAIPTGLDYVVSGTSPSADQTLPGWAQPAISGNVTLYSGGSNWQVQPTANANQTKRPANLPATFVETSVWRTDQFISGTTTIVPATGEGELLVAVPAGLQVDSLELEDRLLEEREVRSGHIVVPVSGAAYVTLRWNTPNQTTPLAVPFPAQVQGEAFFVLPDSNTDSDADAIDVGRPDYVSRRPDAIADVSVPERSNISSLFFREPTAYQPRVTVAAASIAPAFGPGIIAGFLIFFACMATQFTRTGLRAALILAVLGSLLIVTSFAAKTGYILLVMAPVIWWKIPRDV